MITVRKLLLLVCLFLYGCNSFAQECSAIRFSTRNGLAGDNIYWMAQDHDGFLWVATETGVSRFDGTGFKNYTAKDGLPNNDVSSLFVDSRNRVWMAPFKREICYYFNGSIHNRHNDPLLARVRLSSEEKCVAEDVYGNILIETDSCIAFIDTGGHCRNFSKPYKGKGFFLLRKTNGRLSIDIIDSAQRRFQVNYFGRKVHVILHPLGKKLAMMDVEKRIYVMDSSGARREIVSPPDLVSIEYFDDSSLITCTRHGCYVYDVYTCRNKATLLEGLSVNISYHDRESGLWIGTNGAGLYYVPSVKSKSVTWMPGNKQLQVFHFYTGKSGPIAGVSGWQYWQLGNGSLPGRKLKRSELSTALLLLPPGNMQRKMESSILSLLVAGNQIPSFNMACKSQTSSGDTIISTIASGSIYRFLRQGRILDTAVWRGRLTCGTCIGGRYYAGTLEGLYTFTGTGIPRSPENAQQLISGSICAIAYSRQNQLLWVATTDNGIYCLQQNKLLKHFNATSGLSGNTCTCIYTDGTNVYVGTTNGLNVIRPGSRFLIDQYYTTDGLVSDNINCVYAAGNHIWAGTSEGLSYLDMTDRPERTYCRLNVTDVSVSGKSRGPGVSEFELPPGTGNIRFSWSGISFRSMGKMKYRYRLLGLDDTWQTTDQNYLQYPSLPAGNYLFELYAVNRYNVKSALKTIRFTINRHWWDYWWVKALGLAILFAAVAWLLWWRIRRQRQREQEQIRLKEKIIELEQLALRAQMNPHFIFNSLNSFYQYVITKDLPGASRFMNDFSRLIRMLFETTSLTEIALDKEIDFLATYLSLERTKLNDSFSYSFHVQPGIHTEDIVIPSFIIQPFIENSIRHGIQNRHDNLGRITISVAMESDIMTVQVDDNGVGRTYTTEQKMRLITIGNSKGIALTEERIALYNKTRHTDIRFV
jgi:ligand-binding sensor domain-containing protein